LATLPHHLHNGVRKVASRTRRKPNEDYPTCSSHTGIHQLTEVLILGNQNPIISNSLFSNVVVFCTRRHLNDCGDVVIRGAKRTHD
jgi:hypothetical protein